MAPLTAMLWAVIDVHGCMCLLFSGSWRSGQGIPAYKWQTGPHCASWCSRRAMTCRPSILLGSVLSCKFHPGAASWARCWHSLCRSMC